jgi:hypothetical protein
MDKREGGRVESRKAYQFRMLWPVEDFLELCCTHGFTIDEAHQAGVKLSNRIWRATQPRIMASTKGETRKTVAFAVALFFSFFFFPFH